MDQIDKVKLKKKSMKKPERIDIKPDKNNHNFLFDY